MDWEQKNKAEVKKHITQYTEIEPIMTGTFTGKIRFENLTDIELGSLLFALDLPKGCAHKIGMGKPLGLGSVRITPHLYLSSRGHDNTRYQNFSNEWGNHPAEENTKMTSFKKRFEEYILKKIGADDMNRLWEHDRFKEGFFALLHVGVGQAVEKK